MHTHFVQSLNELETAFCQEIDQMGGTMQMNEPAVQQFGAVLDAGEAAVIRRALLIAARPAGASPTAVAIHDKLQDEATRAACSLLAELVGSPHEAIVPGRFAWVPSPDHVESPPRHGGSLTALGALSTEELGEALGLAWTKGALREGRLAVLADALAGLHAAASGADVDTEIARINAEDAAMRIALARLLRSF